MTNQSDKLYHELARMINEGSVGFFFGAGTSRNAGIPIVPVIINNIISSLGFSDPYSGMIKELEMLSRYASLKRKLLKIFKYGKPTVFHILMKHLVEKGLVTQLMTTNFDLLIEKAKIPNINIIFDESTFHRLPHNSTNYIKVHGGINKVNTIKTVMGSIAQRHSISKRKRAIEFFFKEAKLKTIFILGYSCSDKIDLTPCIKSVKNSQTRIVFVQHTSENEIRKSIMPEDNPFCAFENDYIECNTDYLINYLMKHFGFPIPDNSSIHHIDEIDKYMNYSQIPLYKKNLFGAGVLFRNGYYSEAQTMLYQTLQYDGAKYWRAEIVSFLFEVYHNIQSTTGKSMKQILPPGTTFQSLEKEKDEALKTFRKISGYPKRLNKIGELKTHWGHLLLSYQKYDEALLAYQESLDLFERTRNTYRIFQCHNNIANTIFVMWKQRKSLLSDEEIYAECYRRWHKCLTYFSRSEYPFEHEIACENMAELLMNLKKSQKKRISKYLETAKRLSVYLNDQQGVENCDKLLCELYG